MTHAYTGEVEAEIREIQSYLSYVGSSRTAYNKSHLKNNSNRSLKRKKITTLSLFEAE